MIHPAIQSNIHVSAPTITQKMKSRSLSALVAATLFAAASASAAGRAPDLDGDGVPDDQQKPFGDEEVTEDEATDEALKQG